MLNPGLAPWAMQEYRPYRALLRPHQLFVDALVLAVSLINYLLVLIRLSLHPPNEMFAYWGMLVCGLCMMNILIGICLRMRSCTIYSATASAVGTILLHSPGWNEGKARNETLGTHRQK